MHLDDNFKNTPLQIYKHGQCLHFGIEYMFARLYLVVIQALKVINEHFVM